MNDLKRDYTRISRHIEDHWEGMTVRADLSIDVPIPEYDDPMPDLNLYLLKVVRKVLNEEIDDIERDKNAHNGKRRRRIA